jgi:hypothetical protein
MAKNIVFTNVTQILHIDKPEPASSFIPDWYKELDSYLGKIKKPASDGSSTATIKRCIPVFDAITAGYIITTPADVYVSQKDGLPWFTWSQLDLIEFHPVEQAPEHPNRNGMPAYPKWVNPWAIKTPAGYSILITQPFHRESPFTILPGVVDTDTYTAPINFPFVLNDPKWEGMIPAGTPIAQIIPIKRDSWKQTLGGKTELIEQNNKKFMLGKKFFDKYKTMFWHRKDYR